MWEGGPLTKVVAASGAGVGTGKWGTGMKGGAEDPTDQTQGFVGTPFGTHAFFEDTAGLHLVSWICSAQIKHSWIELF